MSSTTTGRASTSVPASPPPRLWTTAILLEALGRVGLVRRSGQVFTHLDVRRWTQRLLDDGQRTSSTSKLCELGFVTHANIGNGGAGTLHRYTLTPEGAVAIQQALAGKVRKSGPKGRLDTLAKPKAAREGSAAQRVWRLLRARRRVTAESAAEVLCDAGDMAAYARMRATIQRTLRRWVQAGVLLEAEERTGASGPSNGFKVYVLPDGAAAEPPTNWRALAEARRKAGGVA